MAGFVVHEKPQAGPGTHVLVIGVGNYPHLIGGDTPCQSPDGMGQLSSPPISARRVAEWFISDYHDPAKELSSLALLLSEASPQPFVNTRTGCSRDVELADADRCEDAIKEWGDRADSDPGNRLVFYFSGHGVAEGNDMALLTSDFCSDQHNPLQGAIDFVQLTGGLKKCRASEQVFFVDACRSSSDVMIGRAGGFAGRVPLLPGLRPPGLPHRLHAPYYSTLAGEKAYARENSVSLFTEALLRSLRGAASDDPENEWRITTTRLQEAIDHFMKQPVFADEIAGVQVPVTGEMSVFDFHHLKGEPFVPVYVGCTPTADNANAEFVCVNDAGQERRRAAGDVDQSDPTREWSLDLASGDYEFRAEFVGAGVSPSISARVRPVYKRISLKASP